MLLRVNGEYRYNNTVLQQVFPNTNWFSSFFQHFSKHKFKNILWCHVTWPYELLQRMTTIRQKDTAFFLLLYCQNIQVYLQHFIFPNH